jgi:ABC-type transporter MlaC component
MFTIGQYARLASERDIEHFAEVFEDYLVGRVSKVLIEYRSYSINVTGATARDGNDVIVNAEVAHTRGASALLKIGFRVRKDRDGRDAIVDVYAGGISLALIAKVAFGYFLFAHEGQLALLSEELIRQSTRIREAEKERILGRFVK